MRTRSTSLWPALLLAAGVLGATALSLLSSRSLAWALAGPFLLAVILVAVGALRRSHRTEWILGSAIVVAGAIVAFADPAYVPTIMPILGACAGVSLIERRADVCTAHGPENDLA